MDSTVEISLAFRILKGDFSLIIEHRTIGSYGQDHMVQREVLDGGYELVVIRTVEIRLR